ncbi:MAG: 16S rRNA (cytidine(1402)-2'-O)-methyltransferase [Capsulimonadales bacterium]|nr:16S rRNA (cytidine(1402)-2'-O)-methyltransferase [Capsulimonadales bacterium]
MAGTLYLVATPIGNLEDITLRALRVLRECDLIAAEDTRVTRKLLAHFEIGTRLTSYHAHTDEGKTDHLIRRLEAGESIALVSDAGTPCISDPGAELVSSAIRSGVRVEPIPGPSAAIAALIGSGLPPARFVFEGFLPRTNDRHERLATIAAERRTVVIFESSPRLTETLGDLARVCGEERPVTVARELTKKFEEFRNGTLADVRTYYLSNEPRGECVLVLGGATETPSAEREADAETVARAAFAQGLSPRDAMRDVMRIARLSRNEAYALIQRLQQAEEEAGEDDE